MKPKEQVKQIQADSKIITDGTFEEQLTFLEDRQRAIIESMADMRGAFDRMNNEVMRVGQAIQIMQIRRLTEEMKGQ